MKKNANTVIDLINEESLVIKELDGRIYFETLPLMTVSTVPDSSNWGDTIIVKPAITGVRG